MKFLKNYIQVVDWINEKTGLFAAWLTTLLVLNVFYDTIMRYVFNKGSIGLQELEWHIFSMIFLIGAAYTLKHDGHVRVDIIYTKMSPRTLCLSANGGVMFAVVVEWGVRKTKKNGNYSGG